MAQNANATVVYSRTRTNKFYAQALGRCPGYTETVKLRAELLRAQQALPSVPAVGGPQRATDIGRWLQLVVETERADQVRALKSNAITGQINHCDRAVEDIVAGDTDDILSRLHTALSQLMARVGKVVDRLDGARSAPQVIDHDVAAVWRELPPLQDAYTEIRAAQLWALGPEDTHAVARGRYPEDELCSDLALSNLDDIAPGWIDDGKPTFNDPRPWPLGPDPLEQLVWLAASNAQPWVPTVDQLRTLARTRATKLNESAEHLVGADNTPARIR